MMILTLDGISYGTLDERAGRARGVGALTSFPLQQDNDSKHTNACSRETTEGQTRCEEAGKPGSRRWRSVVLRRINPGVMSRVKKDSLRVCPLGAVERVL